MALLKNVNLALSFLLEIAMLGAFAYWGFQMGSTQIVQILSGVGLPVIVSIIWGIFIAPRSAKRLKGISYLALASILFGLAALALIAARQPLLGIILFLLFVLNHILIHIWQQ